MQITPRAILAQFAHVLQQQLFPRLEVAVGALSPQLQLLASVIALVPLGGLLTNPPRPDRTASQGSIRPGDRFPR